MQQILVTISGVTIFFPYLCECMKRRIVTLLLMTMLALNSWAQEDTLRVVHDSLQTFSAQGEASTVPFQVSVDERLDASFPQPLPSDSSIRFSFQKPSLILPYHTNPSPLFKGDYSTSGILFARPYGALIGAGSQTSLPGIGRSNDASLTYVHSLGSRWTFSVGMDVNKMHMNHFTGQSFGASGTLTYRASDRLAFNVFGGYNSGYVPGRQSYRYGGTVAWDMTDRFGMEVGVQRYYNPLYGRWETVPIAIPTYKFNNGAKIGFDVGGMLYEIFRSASFNSSVKNGNRPNPTIVPERPRIEIR